YLTTHVYKLEDAPKAYDLILEKSEPFVGIMIKYNPQITPVEQDSAGSTRQAQITCRIHRLTDSRVRISYTLYPMLATGSKISNHESCC
ncbi:MAG: hypothetical protein WCA08_24380, partial [Desulfoferrobacter sp.]